MVRTPKANLVHKLDPLLLRCCNDDRGTAWATARTRVIRMAQPLKRSIFADAPEPMPAVRQNAFSQKATREKTPNCRDTTNKLHKTQLRRTFPLASSADVRPELQQQRCEHQMQHCRERSVDRQGCDCRTQLPTQRQVGAQRAIRIRWNALLMSVEAKNFSVARSRVPQYSTSHNTITATLPCPIGRWLWNASVFDICF